MGLTDLWAQLVDCICRPPRDIYTVEDLIGGADGSFRIAVFNAKRKDMVITNKKGQQLQCSHYIPTDAKGKDGCHGQLPCVIYCHCNSGSRRDAEEAVYVLLPLGVSVFTLDFSGSGLSDGQYVTLGSNEVDDVEVAVEYLRSTGAVSTLGLWGRSMGAVTALLYSQRDPSIAGVVVDSPFSRLTDLMMEIVEEQNLPVPRPLFKMAVAAMKRSVRKKAGFDLDKVSPVDIVANSFIPALFGHATGDTFIKIHHSERIYSAYSGDKNLIRFEGDHNSKRPEFFYSSVSVFFHNTLQLEQVLEGGNRLDAELRRALAGRPAMPPPQTASEGASAAAGAAAAAAVVSVPAAAQQSVELHTSQERSNLDAWGDRARADMTRVMNGSEPDALLADSDDEDPDQVELAKAIQLSLLEAAKEQQQVQQQQQQQLDGLQGAPQQGVGAEASGAAAPFTGPAGAPTPGSRRGQEFVAGPLSAGVAAPASASASAGPAGGAGAQAASRGAGPQGRDVWDAGLLRSRPATEEEEEAMLAEAIRLSLQEGGTGAGAAAGTSGAAPDPPREVGAAGVEADVAGAGTMRSQSSKSYVDQLCDELGDAFVLSAGSQSQGDRQPGVPGHGPGASQGGA